MRLHELRAECPEWSWVAERRGMGWAYVGTLGAHRVTVHAVGRLCGPSEDDFETEWRVDDGLTSFSYVSWWLRTCPTTPAP